MAADNAEKTRIPTLTTGSLLKCAKDTLFLDNEPGALKSEAESSHSLVIRLGKTRWLDVKKTSLFLSVIGNVVPHQSVHLFP